MADKELSISSDNSSNNNNLISIDHSNNSLNINVDHSNDFLNINADHIITDNNLSNQNNIHTSESKDFELIELEHYNCESPLTMSYNGSRSASRDGSQPSDSSEEDNQNNQTNLTTTNQPFSLEDIASMTQHNLSRVRSNVMFKKLTFADVEKFVEKSFNFEQNKFIGELDVLTTFVKGQKNLYIVSKNIYQWKLNLLMIPSLLLTCIITIISPVIECHEIYKGFITALNALVALLLSLINYFKLEASTEMFFQMANHYERLETTLDLASSKLVFIDNKKDKENVVIQTIKDVENKIIEIKDSYSFLIPREVKNLFPLVCHMKIFFFIQKMQNFRNSLIFRLKDIKNEIRYINAHLKNSGSQYNVELEKMKRRLVYLFDSKKEIKNEFLDYQNAYNDLDAVFTKEIKSAEFKINFCSFFYICCWNCFGSKHNFKNVNPVIDKYFHFLFRDD